MQAIAEREGYRTTLLLTRQATHRAVTDAVAAAVRALGESDIFLLTFSGHGGRVPDLAGSGGGAADGRDETWVLYDRALGQDELFALLAPLERGVRVLVLSDSCHSASVLRPRLYGDIHAKLGDGGLEPPRLKIMPAETAKRTYLAHQTVYDEVLRSLRTAERA